MNPSYCGEKGAGDTPSNAWQTSWGAWRFVDGYGNVFSTPSNATFRSRNWTNIGPKEFGRVFADGVMVVQMKRRQLSRPTRTVQSLRTAKPIQTPFMQSLRTAAVLMKAI